MPWDAVRRGLVIGFEILTVLDGIVRWFLLILGVKQSILFGRSVEWSDAEFGSDVLTDVFTNTATRTL